MAKILIQMTPVEGHIFPSLPLMKGLVELGHEVHWLGSRFFQLKIEKTGATFYPIPEKMDYKYAGKTLYEYRPIFAKKKGLDQIKEYIKWFYDEVEELEKPFLQLVSEVQPDLLIGDAAACSPFIYGEVLGIPRINLGVIPPGMLSVDTAPYGSGLMPGKTPLLRLRNKILNYLVDKVLFKDVTAHANRVREKFKLPTYTGVFEDSDDYIDRILITSVPGFDYDRSDFPANTSYIGPYIPKPDSNWKKPDWWGDLEKAKKVILVNQGTIANNIQDLIIPALIALKDEPDTLVVAVPVNEEIPNLPANARVAPYIPFGNLMPLVDVVVTNGGYGGANISLGFGVPMVVSGATEDKIEVAQRVKVSGTGINMKTMKPKPEKLKAAIHEVFTNPKYKQNALRLKKEIESYDSVSLLDQAIQELMEQYEKKKKMTV